MIINNEPDKRICIEKNFSEDQMGEYIRLPFDVPEDTDAIHLWIEVPTEGAVIDLGLEDGLGLRGWSGGARREVVIKQDWATNGYASGGLEPATWSVLLGLYRIQDSCDVSVYIDLYKKQENWYLCDLHMHSTHSDGIYEVNEVIHRASERGLQGIAMTDHNTFTQNEEQLSREDIIVIPGAELTTYHGHANFLGHKHPFTHFAFHESADILQQVNEGRNKGALVVLNHPFYPESWNYGFDAFQFQYVEVWNGPWCDYNRQAVQWWHEELCKGRRMIAIGGSDTHGRTKERYYGIPTNRIASRSFSRQGLIDGIEEGRLCLMSHPEGTWVDLQLGEAKMGEIYTSEKEKDTLYCSIHNCHDGILRVFNNYGMVYEKRILQTNQVVVEVEVDTSACMYRVELVDIHDEGDVKCISNPIFLK